MLCPLDSLETDDNVRNGFAVPGKRIFSFGRSELGYFAFVDFFGLFDPKA